jgi:hypothetical protein
MLLEHISMNLQIKEKKSLINGILTSCCIYSKTDLYIQEPHKDFLRQVIKSNYVLFNLHFFFSLCLFQLFQPYSNHRSRSQKYVSLTIISDFDSRLYSRLHFIWQKKQLESDKNLPSLQHIS